MKKIIVFIFMVLVGSAVFANDPWEEAKKIEAGISRTEFGDRIYNINDFGAVAGNPDILSQKAINDAILYCTLNGGGTVLVPKGIYYTGPVTLKSNVNLHVAEGAELRFSTNKDLYMPAVLTRWEGVDCYNYHPLIYAYGETNIALTGKGIIDAQGTNDNWWSMCGARKYGWTEGKPGQNMGGRNRLLQFEQNDIPMEGRILTHEDAMRPQFINFYRCKTILIQDLTIKNSPFWVIHPLLSEDIIVSGVNVDSHGPNNDGCDPESCKNVLIENCTFNTGDDCIAIKSGRNNDGRRWNIPSENIIVRGCKMVDGHGGVVIGSEISGGYRNLFVEDCEMDSPNLDRVIRIKTSNCRGGLIENVYVRNIKVGECREAVLRINLQYENREQCNRAFPPVVRNVFLDNVTSGKSRYGVLLIGLDDMDNMYNIRVTNSKFDNVERGNSMKGAKDVVLKNVYINGKKSDEVIK